MLSGGAFLCPAAAGALFAMSLGFASPSAAQSACENAAPAGHDKPSMFCMGGTVERYFGGVQWLVLACEDGATLAIVSGPKSPADLSFKFVVCSKDGSYRIHGEGNGDRVLTRPAYDALSAMSADEFRALYAEAMNLFRTKPDAGA